MTAFTCCSGRPGYELCEEIGHGGMGVVYRARDTALDRDVAVKVLAVRYEAGSSVAQRFLSEALITGQLQHPGIPAVHQVGTLADGRRFLAMKLIQGRTLEAILGAISRTCWQRWRPSPGRWPSQKTDRTERRLQAESWETLTAALGLKGVSAGQRWNAPAGVPALSGVVEHAIIPVQLRT
jgi:hypothetical protein